ncbi:hypothetical protein H7Y40_02415 [Pedobacter sp.]|nr:hypothetical protein [Candidatus Saccharibacteria bacterium]
MTKPIIAIDIDDVLSSQVQVLIEFSNENYGTTLTTGDFKAPGEYWGYYEQIWNVGKEEGAQRFQDFLERKIPLRQIIAPETLALLTKLKKDFRLEIVTSRRADYHTATQEWLEKHAPAIFDGVHFVELWDKSDRKVTKAMICQEIGAGYLVDDSVDHCNLAAEAGITALLFGEFGWNIANALSPGVYRVKDWTEVETYLYGK